MGRKTKDFNRIIRKTKELNRIIRKTTETKELNRIIRKTKELNRIIRKTKELNRIAGEVQDRPSHQVYIQVNRSVAGECLFLWRGSCKICSTPPPREDITKSIDESQFWEVEQSVSASRPGVSFSFLSFPMFLAL